MLRESWRAAVIGSTCEKFVRCPCYINFGVWMRALVRITNEKGIGFWKHSGFSPLGVVREFYGDGEGASKMKETLEECTNFTG